MLDSNDRITPVSRRSMLRKLANAGIANAVFASAGGVASLTTGVAIGQSADGDAEDTLTIDPRPTYDLSPHLFMQFMEPLGTNDSSVEASWDHLNDCWRPELIKATQSLAPTMMRWGGIFCDYYHWREAVGPRGRRVPMHNLLWGGIESNQIGTAEFIDFCRQVNADPLICVNFESDGRPHFYEAKGSSRIGDAGEAADWVQYCNNPNNPERRAHGFEQPFGVKYWQIGNETSYDRRGFDLETAARKTVEFAAAMKGADQSIELIGWGDSGWATRMADVAGEHLDYLAFHQMFDPDDREQPVLRGELYRKDPAATWEILMQAWEKNDRKIREVRDADRHGLPLAMTECHFSIPGNNRCDVLRTWAAGVSYARILNNHQRHGDVLKIATAADFAGKRWNVNAIIMGTHPERTFLMPVALVMRQYRQFLGEKAVTIKKVPDAIDAVASRTGNTVYVNLVNTKRDQAIKLDIAVDGLRILSAQGTLIAEDPTTEVSSLNALEVMQNQDVQLQLGKAISLPAAGVLSLAIKVV